MASLKGHLLVASPELRDPNFAQTAVLMIEHTDDGALGLILNRPTSLTVKQAWEKSSNSPCEREETIRLGGPCQGPLMVLHDGADLLQTEVVGGVYYSVEPTAVEQIAADAKRQALFFVGFAGWGPGQLEVELDQEAWVTVPATAEDVFAADNLDWRKLLRRAADAKLLKQLNIKQAPKDPSLN